MVLPYAHHISTLLGEFPKTAILRCSMALSTFCVDVN